MKRNLVLGASGMVGSALMRMLGNSYYSEKAYTMGTYFHNPIRGGTFMDMGDYNSIRKALYDFRPNTIFLCAYEAGVDRCEIDKETMTTNVAGASHVVELAEKIKAHVVFLSSSYVFDGTSGNWYTEEDIPAPINLYGYQKLHVEDALLSCKDSEHTIIRTVQVFGHDQQRKNFVYQVNDNLNMGKKMYIPSDQHVNPIYSMDLAKYILALDDIGARGIWNIAGNVSMTKLEFANHIARLFSLSGELIAGIPTSQMKVPAARPLNGLLDVAKITQVFPDFENINMTHPLLEMANGI